MAEQLKQYIFNPLVGKAKIFLRGERLIPFSEFCLQFSAVYLQFFKRSTTSQTHFGFNNIGLYHFQINFYLTPSFLCLLSSKFINLNEMRLKKCLQIFSLFALLDFCIICALMMKSLRKSCF